MGAFQIPAACLLCFLPTKTYSKLKKKCLPGYQVLKKSHTSSLRGYVGFIIIKVLAERSVNEIGEGHLKNYKVFGNALSS